MLTIQNVIDACSSCRPSQLRSEILKQLTPVCSIYLKNHPKRDELSLIISIPDHVPFIFSTDYSFPLNLSGEKVLRKVKAAKRFVNADIVVLEAFISKGVSFPYYAFYTKPLACLSPQKSNF